MTGAHLFVHRGFLVVRDTDGERKELGQVPLDDNRCRHRKCPWTDLYQQPPGGSRRTRCAVRVVRSESQCRWNAGHTRRPPCAGQADRSSNWSHSAHTQTSLGRNRQGQVGTASGRSRSHGRIDRTAASLGWESAKRRPGQHRRPGRTDAIGPYSLATTSDATKAAKGSTRLLNYGYTILRSAMARAVVASGLHPSLGLHHSNDANAMRLVDDLMEPFRPVVDLKVWQLNRAGRSDGHARNQTRACASCCTTTCKRRWG